MKSVNEIIEICDIDTGELLLQSRKVDFITSDGLQNFLYFYQKFLDLVRDGRNVSINCTAFDVRYNIRDAENIFMNFKRIEGIF